MVLNLEKRLSKTKTYSYITIIGALIGVITGGGQVYEYLSDILEKEKQEEEDRKQELLNKLEYSIEVLPNCFLSQSETSRITHQFDIAVNELILNDNYKKSNQIFENEKEKLIECPQQLVTIGVTVGHVTSMSILGIVTTTMIIISLIIVIIFGILWKRESKKDKHKKIQSDSK